LSSEDRIQEPPPKLGPGGAFLLVLIHLAGAMTVGLLAINLANDRSIMLFIAAGVIVGPLMALYVGLNRYTPHLTTRQALRLERPRGRSELALLGAAIIAGAALSPLATEVTVRIFRAWPLQEAAGAFAEPSDTMGRILLDIAYLLVSPVTQEALFRGLILGGLRVSVGRRRALFVATVLYVAAIIQPHVMPAALMLALVTGVLALRGRSLWIPIAAHITTRLFDGLILWGEEWPSATNPGPAPQPLWLLGLCGGVLVVTLVALWRTGDQTSAG
jgi:uncharacterized protein